MKNKGFTLIELLAVIVILAIIALIATPIILGIINNVKEESDERSVELYASAIKNALATHQLNGNNPISGTGYTSDSLEAMLDVDYDGDVDCSVIDITTDGKVSMSGCKVNGGTKEYSYGKEQSEINDEPICSPATIATIGNIPSGNYDAEDEYLCKVDPSKDPYVFVVLGTNESGTINLIMGSNINQLGEPTTGTDGNSPWITDVAYSNAGGQVTDSMMSANPWCEGMGKCAGNEYGPLTAIEHLNNATQNWVTTTTETKTYPKNTINFVKARLPYGSELYDEDTTQWYTWLGNVWSLDSANTTEALGGSVAGPQFVMNSYGIRPVITISTSDIG